LDAQSRAVTVIEAHQVSNEAGVLNAEESSGRPEHLFGQPDTRKAVTGFYGLA